MRKRVVVRVAAAFAVLPSAAVAIAPSVAAGYPPPGRVVGDAGVHDPSLVIRPWTISYVLASTHNQVRFSADRIAFESVGGYFKDPPSWTDGYYRKDEDWTRGFWAPDVSFHNGRYWLYYSVSSTGSQKSAIGLATSPTADPYSWTDHGKVIATDWHDGVNYNAIDANLFVDEETRKWWLVFGSYWNGIQIVELDPASGMIKSGATPVSIARRGSAPATISPSLDNPEKNPAIQANAVEGPSLFKRGPYYYLFASYGSCCPPPNPPPDHRPTYHIKVGRSTSPTGPYYDSAHPTPVAMTAGGGHLVLAAHDWVQGPGGQSVIHDPAWGGHDLLVYHYYDSRLAYLSFLGINYLGWDDRGWPYVW